MINDLIKKFTVICLSALFLFLAIGCNIQKGDPDKFTTDVSYSASQYTMFVNKQITTVTNQLTTQMAMADSIANSSNYPIEDAILSANSSIQIVEECRDNIKTMLPPAEYAENRESTLKILESIISTLETYRDSLKSTPIDVSKIKDLIKIMENDYMALTAQSNIYWE